MVSGVILMTHATHIYHICHASGKNLKKVLKVRSMLMSKSLEIHSLHLTVRYFSSPVSNSISAQTCECLL